MNSKPEKKQMVLIKMPGNLLIKVGAVIVILWFSFCLGVYVQINMSKKIDYNRGLEAIYRQDYTVAEAQFKYVYGNYRANTGKDKYQKVSVLALGLLRIKHINQGKLDNIYKVLDELYDTEVVGQIKTALNDYKQNKSILSDDFGLNIKEAILLSEIIEALQVD